EQPGLGPGRVTQLVKLELGLAERLLGQVLRVGGRTGQAIGVAVQRAVMLLDQPLHTPLAAGQAHGTRSPPRPDASRGRFIPAYGGKTLHGPGPGQDFAVARKKFLFRADDETSLSYKASSDYGAGRRIASTKRLAPAPEHSSPRCGLARDRR